MTKIVYMCLMICGVAFFGCTEQTERIPEANAVEVVELSEEELDILEASADTSQIDLGEINADNYEEALRKLEEAIDSE